MVDTLKTAANHTVAIFGAPKVVEFAADVAQSPDDISRILQLVTTVVVCISTLINIFKKPAK